MFERHKALLVTSNNLTLAQAQAAALFFAVHDEPFWDACVKDLLGVEFAEKYQVFMALSEFGRKAASCQGGLALQQLLRDLGLPDGPNPGQEMLQRVKAALALGDTKAYEALHEQVIQRQHEICTAGGEHLLLLQPYLSRWQCSCAS